MLTKVTVYSQWSNIDPLVLNVINRPETDLFEVRNIDGLGAVKADVNTTSLGSVDGTSFVGSNVGERNIVFTIGLDPDWNDWTISRLRRLLDKYFMPKLSVRFVFETMEFSPVEISGYVEANEPNMFSKDPEHQISIICPELYFKSVIPTVLVGQTNPYDPIAIDYQGNVKTGINVEVTKSSGTDPELVVVNVIDENNNFIQVDHPASGPPVTTEKKFVMNSVPGSKYIRSVDISSGDITNLLNDATMGFGWPEIGPGTTDFVAYSEAGIQDWTLTYYNLFGSL